MHMQMVVEKDGVLGLFGRGLKTKIISNGMQVRWQGCSRYLQRAVLCCAAVRCGVVCHQLCCCRFRSSCSR